MIKCPVELRGIVESGDNSLWIHITRSYLTYCNYEKIEISAA